jgi:hypothetical protein
MCAWAHTRQLAGAGLYKCDGGAFDDRRRSAGRRAGVARPLISGFDVVMIRARHGNRRCHFPEGLHLEPYGLPVLLVRELGRHAREGFEEAYSKCGIVRCGLTDLTEAGLDERV